MVIISETANFDIDNIIIGLINWKTKNNQCHMSIEHIIRYVNWLCDEIEMLESYSYFEIVESKYSPYRYQIKRKQSGYNWFAYCNFVNNNILVERIVSESSLANNKVKIHGFEYFA